MPSYMPNPQILIIVTHSGTDYYLSAKNTVVIRIENGFDTATVLLDNQGSETYLDKATENDAIEIKVKDASENSWTTIFKGVIDVANPSLMNTTGDLLTLKCAGAGYGLAQTACGQEYGTQSKYPTLDTIAEIITDATHGILPAFTNKILEGGASGFSYTNTVETIAGTITFYSSPYKPCMNVINDLCDLVTALKDGSAGPHWIVTTGSKFLLATIASHHVDIAAEGWTTYYGGSQSAATLEQGKDFLTSGFNTMRPEANYVLHYGVLRKPPRDIWSEGNAADWTGEMIISDEETIVKVGDYSLKCDDNGGLALTARYSFTDLDLTKLGSFRNPPLVSYWKHKMGAVGVVYVILAHNDLNNYFYHTVFNNDSTLNIWSKDDIVVGPYAEDGVWTVGAGAPSWTNINRFIIQHVTANQVTYWDDIRFEGLICRAAYNSDNITDRKAKMKTIIDNVGKDDSGSTSDNTGTIALLTYADLLKMQSTPTIAQVVTCMIKDLLPGQLLHIHGEKKIGGSFNIDKDMRVSKLTHYINEQGFTTVSDVTDDLANSTIRTAHNDWNTIFQAVRPDYQDRQATNIKAGEVDLDVPILAVDYA